MANLAWLRLRDLFTVALVVALTVTSALAAESAYLEPEQAFRGQARALDGRTLEVRIDVAPGYHLYRERISVELDGGGAALAGVEIPRGRVEHDANFDRDVELLQGAVPIRVAVARAAQDLRLRVAYQGCADEGLCYPPQTAIVSAAVGGGAIERAAWLGDIASAPAAAVNPALAPAPNPAPATAANAAPASEMARVESALKSGRLPLIAGVFLVAGLLLAFTPCVLPMVPILSAIIVGEGGRPTRLRGFALALAYALGMATVYTAFGVVAGLLGEGLAASLQNPWVLGFFALLLATLALGMFGAFELQMPGFVQSRLSAAASRMPGGRFAGVFAMGGLSALIVGPCVAAPLAGTLVFISQTRDVVIGGLALFSLAMGMSVPLLLVGVSAGSLLPRAGSWMASVKVFFGALLLAVALWIVAPVLPAWATMILIGAALLVAAVYLKVFDRLADFAPGRQRLAKGVGLVLAVLGTTQVVGALSGGADPLQPLRHLARGSEAGAGVGVGNSGRAADFKRIRTTAELDAALKSAGRPVLLDFYADWCVSCKEMEHLTFGDPTVQARMAGALLLQADVTANSDDDKTLLKRYGLFGPPGILFFDPRGTEQVDARVIGFVPPQQFNEALRLAGL
ncbi:MAG: protein-disulfide reductase DsbD [Ideonella sp.]|nr:protein-disulfide reductase DsbD [Ideonella sp.]